MSTLADEVARLTKDLEAAENEITGLAEELEGAVGALEEAERELEGYQVAFRDDEYLQREIKILREFIEDVRLGIRDLSEYDAVCDPVYL